MSSSDESSSAIGFMYCICAIAVLCNVIVLVVIWWSKRLRAGTDFYLVNLAISDILMSGLAMPLKLVNAAAHGFYGGNIVCKIVMFIPMFTIMSCISTLVAISCDRYFAIVRLRSASTTTVAITIGVVWLISILTSSPQLYEYSVYEKDYDHGNESVCGSYGIAESFEMYYAIVVLIVCYVAPLIIIACMYGRIINYIIDNSRSTNLGRSADGTSQGQVLKVKIKILKMLILVTVVFAALWLPYFVMFTIEEITDTDDIEDVTWLHTFKTILVTLSTVSNPVIYALFNANFRREMRAMISCRSRVAPNRDGVTMTSMNGY